MTADSGGFDPLDGARCVECRSEHIALRTPYSEELAGLCRSIPGAKWDFERRYWAVPYSSIEPLRGKVREIERLSAEIRRATPKKPSATTPDTQFRLPTSPEGARPLRREFTRPIEGRPTYHLQLEAIGEDLARGFWAFGFRPRHSVCRVWASNGRGGWVKDYLRGDRCYANANSKGSRGVMVSYFLDEGPIYHICDPKTWSQTDRYFARIINGEMIRMSDDEVVSCLEK